MFILYNDNFGSMLLGCLCNQTETLYNPAYPLSKNDFDPSQFHKIIFSAIIHLSEQGARSIEEIDIDTFLKDYPPQYEIFTDSNGLDFINSIKELCKEKSTSYELYWQNIRKFSLLRDMKKNGFSIEEYYDEAKSDESQCANLNKFTIQEILNEYEVKSSKLRNKYDVHYVKDEIRAGENVEERLEAFEQAPAIGANLQSAYLTTLFNGWCRGHLGLRGGASGLGKSRMAVADLMQVGAKELRIS